jgi:hypothetical protein
MSDDYDRQPPQDLHAEQCVLGAMLLSRDAIRAVVDTFGDDADRVFYRPIHQLIYDVIVAQVGSDEPTDAVTVAAALSRRNMLHRLGGAPYLHTLISTVPTAANAAYYAEIVAEKATLRRVVEAGTRIVQLGYQAVSGDDVEAVVAFAQETVGQVSRRVRNDDSEVVTLDALLSEPETPEDWVVPGLLERMDRLILTGWEGLGKSELLVQLAFGIASGVHPFTGAMFAKGDPMKVLIVDGENTRKQLRRRLGRVLSIMNDLRKRNGFVALSLREWGAAVHLVCRPDGMDLSRPSDVAQVERALTAMGPDLLVVGPLYKLAGYNTKEEEGALKLLQRLDQWRVRHNCALIAEAHAGHEQNGQPRSTRPRGSAVLKGWPEFGLGLATHEDHLEEERPTRVHVRRWRGDREVRDWPRELKFGGRGRLPWVPREP